MLIGIAAALVAWGGDEQHRSGLHCFMKIAEHVYIFKDMFHHINTKDQIIPGRGVRLREITIGELYIIQPALCEKTVAIRDLFFLHIHSSNIALAVALCDVEGILPEA